MENIRKLVFIKVPHVLITEYYQNNAMILYYKNYKTHLIIYRLEGVMV